MWSIRVARHNRGQEFCFGYYRHLHLGPFIIWTKFHPNQLSRLIDEIFTGKHADLIESLTDELRERNE